jgi:hypothetical protein
MEEEEEEEEDAPLEEEEEAKELCGVDDAAEDRTWSGKRRRCLGGSCFAFEKRTEVSEEKPSTCESPSTMDSFGLHQEHCRHPECPFLSSHSPSSTIDLN